MTIIKEECTNELRWHNPSYSFTDAMGIEQKAWHSPRLQQKYILWTKCDERGPDTKAFYEGAEPEGFTPIWGKLSYAKPIEQWRDVPVVEE